MANFIIKPASSGSTILQDEGGDAAVTVAANGNATFAGTANNFGTISSDTTFPAGHIIQTVQKVKQDTYTCAVTNETLIPNFDVHITPIKASSKILINYSFAVGVISTLTAYTYMQRKIGTAAYAHLAGIHGATHGGSALPALAHGGGKNGWESYKKAGMYLDSPSYTLGNKISYRIGVRTEISGTTEAMYIGRTHRDSSIYHPREASILICMEVAG